MCNFIKALPVLFVCVLSYFAVVSARFIADDAEMYGIQNPEHVDNVGVYGPLMTNQTGQVGTLCLDNEYINYGSEYLQFDDCDDGSDTQSWLLLSDGHIMQKSSGLCLSAEGHYIGAVLITNCLNDELQIWQHLLNDNCMQLVNSWQCLAAHNSGNGTVDIQIYFEDCSKSPQNSNQCFILPSNSTKTV